MYRQSGHRVNNTEKCNAFNSNINILLFRADTNILSNMYMNEVIHERSSYKSAEHMYQHLKFKLI